MTTYIKGTFPVRFRRDGKDGVNVWVKYATVLDLKDSNTGKSYPSNNHIFNEPTAECKYIGIGKGVGDEPTQGQYYDWKKYIGDDGTSFTAKGQAIAHYTTLTAYNSASKSVGLYLIDASAGALLKYWNGSASENRSVEDGDGYTTADKHLWVKDGAKWNDLGEIQGPKGDPAYIDTIYLKGTSNSSSTSYAEMTIVRNNISTKKSANKRGLIAYKINRTTLAVTDIGIYDTYDSSSGTTNANSLATEINKLDTTFFLAIVSFNACGFSSNLVTAIKQFGGNDIADLTAKKQAFCFLGYKGMAQGTALQVLNIGNAKIAEISSIVSNGVCQGSGQGGNSILSVTNYYLGSSSSTEPIGKWNTDPSKSGFSASKPYLWNYEVTTFSLSSPKETEKRVIGVWSKDGKGIKSITEYYLATSASSGVTTEIKKWPWTTTIQTISPSKKYLWNYEIIAYTDGTSDPPSDPRIIGVYGDKGNPGNDAVSYKMSSSISAIPLDNDAYPTVSSFTLTAYKFVGNASAAFDDSYQLVAIISYSGSTTPITVSTKLGSSSRMTVYLRTDGLSSGSLIKDIRSVSCYLYHGSVALDSFVILPIKAGAAGVSYFPNMRGYWQAGTSYSWLNGSRDMVTYNKDGVAYLYAVKTAGTTVKTCPLSDAGTVNSGWEEAATPFSMLFANFVYTDNASVAGFKWSDEVMQSPNGLLELNGKTGKITAKSGTIGGINITEGGIMAGSFEDGFFVLESNGTLWAKAVNINGHIEATEGTFDNCTINETCKVGFMKYATNKFNGNIINCGCVDFNAGYGITGSTTLYLPSVSKGEYMKIIVSNFVTTKIYIPDFTLAVEGNGTLHDLFDYPLGVYTKKTLFIGRMAYYEFTGINEQGYSRWICTNSMFT